MQWPTIPLAATCALLASAPAHLQAADDRPSPSPTRFSAEVGIGAEYDSNVSVDELDASSSESDYALTMDAKLRLQHQLNPTTDLGFTYDFGQTLYEQFSELDRQTHMLGADVDVDLGKTNAGASFYYINSLLDYDAFLEFYRVSPSLSGFLAKKWFARGAYVYADKTIEDRSERDATSHAGEVDLYFFRRGLRSYFNVGYRYRKEDANAAQYDNRAHSFKLRYVHRFEVMAKVVKMELAWRYEDRDYTSITPAIGEERADERQRWKLDLEVPVLQRGALQFYGGYGAYDSNYEPADYSQTVVGTRFLYRW
jgi:hypothetical protein